MLLFEMFIADEFSGCAAFLELLFEIKDSIAMFTLPDF
jgi:hypothetical protein